MKKLEVDFSYLSNEMIKAIAMIYKDGFKESDVISFKEVHEELGDRVRFVLNDTVFFVKTEQIENIISGVYDDNFFPPKNENGNCDAEFC
ncbi:hypothetical protein ACFQ1M_12170 [Sungkyunkwania multivorans]|uniref:Uncharacterized protein n=1 Tax=Sungkyunkwania multivorans TaxID=1173618 RepID=A0ABW3D0F8_9FLAO